MTFKAALLPLALQLLASSAALASPAALYPPNLHWRRQDTNATSSAATTVSSATAAPTTSASSSAATTASSTASAASSRETPGFANNGTIGSYPCIYASQDVESQLIFGADSTVPGTSCPEAQAPVYPFNTIELRAPDDSMRATVLPYGAVVSELWVKDRYGGWRDIVLGYDNKTNYGTDPIHPNFSPVVGRYANRIKNGTFELDGQTYNVPKNENGLDSLHGGDIGYDRSNFTITSLSANEIVLQHVDPDGFQGFPGEVTTLTRYTLDSNATWHIEMNATADKKTPILLSSHVYWNLAAFNETNSTLDYVLHMPYADQYVETDTILIPTGPLPSVNSTPYDFQSATPFSKNFDNTTGVCGFNCTGWDSCWIMSNPPGYDTQKPVLEMYSPQSGIKMSVASNQAAIQIYTCPGVNNKAKGSIPRKLAHGGKTGSQISDVVYDNYECVVVEMEDYIDGINNPDWGRQDAQIFGPDKPYYWKSTYTFSNVDENGQAL